MPQFFADAPYLLRAALNTISMAAACIVASALLGLIVGIVAAVGPRVLRVLIAAYVFIVRGTPLLIQIFLAYFGLPLIGIRADRWIVVFLAVSVYLAALITEIVRGAILALPAGQTEAGRALGLRRAQIVLLIVIPQALRFAVAPYISMLPVTVKATSLGSVIGFWELTLATREVVDRTLEPFGVFAIALGIYFVLCFPLTYASTRLERRLMATRH